MAGIDKSLDKFKKRLKGKIRTVGKTLFPTSKEDFRALKDPENRPGTVAGSLNLAAQDVEGSLDEVGTMFTPDIPQPEEQPVMPIPDESLQANEARRRRARQSRTGRRSTILTGLGG